MSKDNSPPGYLAVRPELEYSTFLVLPPEDALELLNLIERAKTLQLDYGTRFIVEPKEPTVQWVSKQTYAECLMAPVLEP